MFPNVKKQWSYTKVIPWNLYALIVSFKPTYNNESQWNSLDFHLSGGWFPS